MLLLPRILTHEQCLPILRDCWWINITSTESTVRSSSEGTVLTRPHPLTIHVVDWEYPEFGRQSLDFIHLLTVVRTYFPTPRYLVTTALPAGEWCLNRFDLPQLASKLDFLNLMGYDFTGNWGAPIMSGHHGIHFDFFSLSLIHNTRANNQGQPHFTRLMEVRRVLPPFNTCSRKVSQPARYCWDVLRMGGAFSTATTSGRHASAAATRPRAVLTLASFRGPGRRSLPTRIVGLHIVLVGMVGL